MSFVMHFMTAMFRYVKTLVHKMHNGGEFVTHVDQHRVRLDVVIGNEKIEHY